MALTIFLCKTVINCSAEHSFSFLERIKNYLKSNTSEDGLNWLATLGFKADLLKNIDFDNVMSLTS